MHILDSNIIIALFRREEKDHETASRFFSTLKEFAISDHVLFEIGTILKKKEGQETTKKAIEFLVFNKNSRLLRLSAKEIEMSTQFFLSENKISFVDASLLVMAKERNLSLATFDKEMSKAGARL